MRHRDVPAADAWSRSCLGGAANLLLNRCDCTGRAQRLIGIHRMAVFVLMLVCCGSPAPDGPMTAGAADVVRITDDGLLKQRPQWSPDRGSVVFARHQGTNIALYRRELTTGKEERLTNHDAPEYDAVFMPDGKSLVFAYDKTSPNQGNIDVYRVNLADKMLTPMATNQGKLSHEESPSVSPAGKHIAFTSTRDGNQELYSMPVAGGEWTRLTSDPAIDAHPAWSPDGKTIAFATNRWGDLEIALIEQDGTNLRRLTNSPGLDDYPAWSPDGRFLAFTSNRDGNFEIYVARGDGSDAKNITRSKGIDNFPTWIGPSRIGFVSNRDNGFDIYTTAVKFTD